MNYPRLIFIGKSALSVWITILIAFAFLVIFNGHVEAFSFPAGQLLTYQGKSYHPDTPEVISGMISHTQEIGADGFDKGVKLTSSIPADGQSVTHKKPNQASQKTAADGDRYWNFQTVLLVHLIIFIICVFVGYFLL